MEQEMSHGGQYEPLPRYAQLQQQGSSYRTPSPPHDAAWPLGCSLPEGDMHTPDLVGGEEYEWAAINNLDVFFTRVYR
jgi:hypothetical protein